MLQKAAYDDLETALQNGQIPEGMLERPGTGAKKTAGKISQLRR